MRPFLKLTAAAAMLFALPGLASAQTDAPQTGDAAAPAQMQMMSPQMMQSMMQMMQMMQGCMGMMQMMHGNMHGGMGDMPMQGGMMGGNMPMMQGWQSSDPDTAFIKGMIPHHQGAIDMAKVVLQYGKDEQVKGWANQIIAAQEKEIAEMQDWLKAHGR